MADDSGQPVRQSRDWPALLVPVVIPLLAGVVGSGIVLYANQQAFEERQNARIGAVEEMLREREVHVNTARALPQWQRHMEAEDAAIRHEFRAVKSDLTEWLNRIETALRDLRALILEWLKSKASLFSSDAGTEREA